MSATRVAALPPPWCLWVPGSAFGRPGMTVEAPPRRGGARCLERRVREVVLLRVVLRDQLRVEHVGAAHRRVGVEMRRRDAHRGGDHGGRVGEGDGGPLFALHHPLYPL